MLFHIGRAENGSDLAYEFHKASCQSWGSRRGLVDSTGLCYLRNDILDELSCLDIASRHTIRDEGDTKCWVAFQMVLVRSRERDTARALVPLKLLLNQWIC